MAKVVKVILEKGLKKLGSAGQVVSVRPGYAFNYLIPNKIVSLATKEAEAMFEQKKAAIAKSDAEHLKNARDLETILASQSIMFEANASENGKLYGSIAQADIADYINKHFKLGSVKVEKSQIVMNGHIKEYGVSSVKVELHPSVIVNMKVSVANTSDLAQKNLEKA